MRKKFKNIILVGFMGSGKTSVSQYLNKVTRFNLIDVDQVIEKKESMKISEIFEKKGEEYFRGVETSICNSLYKLDDCIVSTGGGIVTLDQNCRQLKSSGVIVWLDINKDLMLKRVKNGTNRPLVNDSTDDDLIKLYESRNKIYERISDITINVDGYSVTDIGQFVIKKFYEYVNENSNTNTNKHH